MNLEQRIKKALKKHDGRRTVSPGEAEMAGLLREVLECDVCPPGTLVKLGIMEETDPIAEHFEPQVMESQHDGFCNECGVPYAEGEQILWLGPGRGALCSGCGSA